MSEKKLLTGLSEKFFYTKLALRVGRFSEWKQRYGKVNEHNGSVPRDHWLEQWERDLIIDFYLENETDGYRRCCYMMIDRDLVYCSPATVYNVLKKADAMRVKRPYSSRKGDGFEQPLKPHEHWHTDISQFTAGDTVYFLISVIDGFSRFIVHSELRESMKTADAAIVIQKAKEKYPEATPRIISDNGSQYKAADFKQLLNFHNMSHVFTSPYYPQSNGKLERWHQSIKNEAIRLKSPLTKEDAEKVVNEYVNCYNNERLHSSIDYVTPKDKLNGLDGQIKKEREIKLENRRKQRKLKREKTRQNSSGGAKINNTEANGSQELIRISAEGCDAVALCRISS